MRRTFKNLLRTGLAAAALWLGSGSAHAKDADLQLYALNYGRLGNVVQNTDGDLLSASEAYRYLKVDGEGLEVINNGTAASNYVNLEDLTGKDLAVAKQLIAAEALKPADSRLIRKYEQDQGVSHSSTSKQKEKLSKNKKNKDKVRNPNTGVKHGPDLMPKISIERLVADNASTSVTVANKSANAIPIIHAVEDTPTTYSLNATASIPDDATTNSVTMQSNPFRRKMTYAFAITSFSSFANDNGTTRSISDGFNRKDEEDRARWRKATSKRAKLEDAMRIDHSGEFTLAEEFYDILDGDDVTIQVVGYVQGRPQLRDTISLTVTGQENPEARLYADLEQVIDTLEEELVNNRDELLAVVSQEEGSLGQSLLAIGASKSSANVDYKQLQTLDENNERARELKASFNALQQGVETFLQKEKEDLRLEQKEAAQAIVGAALDMLEKDPTQIYKNLPTNLSDVDVAALRTELLTDAAETIKETYGPVDVSHINTILPRETGLVDRGLESILANRDAILLERRDPKATKARFAVETKMYDTLHRLNDAAATKTPGSYTHDELMMVSYIRDATIYASVSGDSVALTLGGMLYETHRLAKDPNAVEFDDLTSREKGSIERYGELLLKNRNLADIAFRRSSNALVDFTYLYRSNLFNGNEKIAELLRTQGEDLSTARRVELVAKHVWEAAAEHAGEIRKDTRYDTIAFVEWEALSPRHKEDVIAYTRAEELVKTYEYDTSGLLGKGFKRIAGLFN